jgi:MFS family permease
VKTLLSDDKLGIATAPPELYSRIKWRIVPLLMVCLLFAWFDRINIGFVKYDMQHSFPLSNTAYGLGASLFVIGYIIFEVPSNVMLYRIGARRWFARILITWGLASAAMVFVRSETAFYVLRFIIGSAEAGFTPGIFFYLGTWIPPHQRGRTYGVLYQAVALSGVLGAPLSGFILTHFHGVGGLPAWNWVFLLGGLPCVVLGVIVWFRLEDRFEDVAWLSAQEKSHLREALSAQPLEAATSRASSLSVALRSPAFLVVALVWFITQIAAFGMNFLVPHIVRYAGISNRMLVGAITAIPYLFGSISMFLVGSFADRLGDRRMIFTGCMVATGIGFLGSAIFENSLIPLVACLGLVGAGVLTAYTTFWSLPPKVVAGSAAASGIAVINCVGQLGGIVSPIAVGKIIDVTGSITPALYAIASVCGVCVLVTLFLFPKSLRIREIKL